MNSFKLITDSKKYSITYREMVFGVVIEPLPSWNEILYLHPQKQSKIMAPTRALGYQIGIQVAKRENLPIKLKKIIGAKTLRRSFVDSAEFPLTSETVQCLVLVCRERSDKDPEAPRYRRDVYNPIIKGIVDGFIEAGLFIDDSEIYHSGVNIQFIGLSDKPYMEIRFYKDRGLNYD